MTGIKGVYAAAITPRRTGGTEIDLAAAFELVDFLAARKVDGIVLMGSTGEFVHFSVEERVRYTNLVIKRSRVPVIVNVSHSTLDGSIELGRAAARAGAAAVLLMPPYFFRYSQSEILAFFDAFAADSDPRCPRLLYQIPLFTSPIHPETAARLLTSGGWHGIKDSSGDWGNFEKLARLRTEAPFTLLMGDDSLLRQAIPGGADGAISGVASAVPELLVALYSSASSGAAEVATRTETRLHQFLTWFGRFPVPVAVREAVALRGLKAGPNAALGSPQLETTLAEFRLWFREWLQAVEREAAHA